MKLQTEFLNILKLETGKVTKKATTKKSKLPKATQPITNETVIGIEYRTYKEKKKYLQSVIGNQFHFTIHLLDYFKKILENKHMEIWCKSGIKNKN